MKYDWLPLAEDNYNRRWQASDAILIISVDVYSGIVCISMTIGHVVNGDQWSNKMQFFKKKNFRRKFWINYL